MSGKTAYLENAWLKLLLNGTAIANFADNTASSPATNLYISLHTTDPTDTPATEQTTGETTYTGYARQAVARTTGGWTVTGSVAVPVASVNFPVCTAAPGGTIQYVGIGTASSGNGKLLQVAALSPTIPMTVGTVPTITTASTLTEY